MLCRRCGTTIHDGLRVCPHCGERQAQRPSTVSCSHCRHRTSAASSVCPHCGQSLRARRLSGSLVVVLGVILVAGLALSVSIASRHRAGLQQTAEDRLARLETGISELGGKVLDTASSLAVAQPELVTETPTPVVVLAALPDNPAQVAMTNQVIVLAPTTVGMAIGGGNGAASLDGVTPIAESEPASLADETPTAEPTATLADPTATPTATAVEPTATPTPTEIPATPTPPPTPTSRPTQAPATPTRPAATPTRALPTPTPVEPTAEPTHTVVAAAAAAGPVTSGATYTVQPGDNWFSIAQRLGITQDTLAAYNDSTPSDILQVDQVLRVPPAGLVITLPTATPTQVQPTATRPATATPAPTATPPIVMLAAPSLVRPMNGDGFASETQPVLAWRPVTGMGSQDFYHVQIRYTLRDGQPALLEDQVPATITTYTVPMWFFDLARTPDRLGVWSVQVRRTGANGQPLIISPFSESRTFYWR
jgi:LysM repeat protein/RNA polymerase subunit RPABC4/transcription elongation factor Spt4